MKILYIHGLGSTKDGNTVNNLRKALPEHEIVAYDVPLAPRDAFREVSEWAKDCDLVVGSSLGGFYAQLADCPKVLINPALQVTQNIMDVAGKGTFEYFGPRVDGVQTYTLDDEYYKELAEVEHMLYDMKRGEEHVANTSIIFGTEDEELGDSNHQFATERYVETSIHFFEGMGHRMDEAFMDKLVEIIIKSLE